MQVYLQEGERFFQKNEGQWDFSLQEDEAGSSVELSVDVGKFLDTSLIKVSAAHVWETSLTPYPCC
jgi:hypothetical protein